jgi:hypothetical protein
LTDILLAAMCASLIYVVWRLDQSARLLNGHVRQVLTGLVELRRRVESLEAKSRGER